MIDSTALATIEAILRKGDRAEIIPVKNGVKIFRVRREIAESVEKWTQQSIDAPASKR